MYPLYLFPVIFILFFSCKSSTEVSKQTQQKDNKKTVHLVPFGDPFILLYNNTYYAYGTLEDTGIAVYTSTNLETWNRQQSLALDKTNSWGSRWFWAPEVYEVQGKFYMYYTADEHICVATSNSPLGPFVQAEKKPMISDEKTIDNTLFIDKDGKAYVYFVRFNDGMNIWGAELTNDLLSIKPETMKACIRVSQPWEEVWPSVNEGAYVIERKGIYYMTYSANNYQSQLYGVGYATSNSPLGPWVKYAANPILQSPRELVGVGHSAMFLDKENKMRIVFHAHHSKQKIHPRAMYIGEVEFSNDEPSTMKIKKDILYPVVIP